MKLATLIRSKSLVQLGTQMFLDLYPEIDSDPGGLVGSETSRRKS